ncbi:hypothetical protein [Hoeflea poritis]|uniref:Uncharacterized protein n=1 Tax=Hoeflea poritis TaxID=2993659 RepID=A0ABT4VU39_9HYPH|nr:hypothetical protein [Hoeflea poritis]MDA4848226.1 hypothetical protein [Hoeflea poritis]
MKFANPTVLAIAAAVSVASLSAANADGPRRAGMAAAGPMKIQSNAQPAAKPFDNTAYAWTAACYAEFGPDAKYPDAALLDKCLNF